MQAYDPKSWAHVHRCIFHGWRCAKVAEDFYFAKNKEISIINCCRKSLNGRRIHWYTGDKVFDAQNLLVENSYVSVLPSQCLKETCAVAYASGTSCILCLFPCKHVFLHFILFCVNNDSVCSRQVNLMHNSHCRCMLCQHKWPLPVVQFVSAQF